MTSWNNSDHRHLRQMKSSPLLCNAYIVVPGIAFLATNQVSFSENQLHQFKQQNPHLSSFAADCLVDSVWNVMAHAQKPDFVFRRNGRVHINRRGRQFSRLLAAKLCVSAVVMLDTACSEVVWRVLTTHSIRQFPLHFPSLRHRVPSHFNWTLVMLDTPCSEVVWRVLATHSIRQFPFHFPSRASPCALTFQLESTT
jgi:hypothetical protein